jgi:serine/threonine protein kinase/tetratricopeptide (TPR) repeat protein
MRHFSPGLFDSIASVIADPTQCPHCDSSSRVVGGLCVGCLLQSGLELGDECAPETLVSALAEISLPDKNWRLGNYEILEEIGRGGMGVIYRARQRHSRRIVAVKRVLGYHADSRETLARFRREAQAAASLDHPNILPIYEVSESEDGLPFFSMKFAPGGSLQEVGPALRNEPRQCVTLVAKIARAVQHAHGKGILHRDLKPGNILLDAQGEPLVSDFGLAKWLDTTSNLTRTLTIFGTPGYIAPEQASGPAEQLKPTADVYSLGAILFDLLAGRPPFLGSHALSVIRQASETSAPKLRTLSKIADRDLETICAHCLEREPSARYPSAHDLATDLERWLEGRPIVARQISAPTRVWRWSRRNRKLAGAVAACLILGFVAVFTGLRSSRLGSIVRDNETARLSVLITPFEDLDEVSTDSKAANDATRIVTSALADHTTVRICTVPPASRETVYLLPLQRLRNIAKEAGARTVLTGSVRTRDGRKRVTMRVLEASTGGLVRSWIFEGGFSSDLAQAAGNGVSGVIESLGKEPSKSSALGDTHEALARSYFEAGKEFFFRYNLEDLERAIDSFERALQIDPDYAEAHALLASACHARFVVDPGGPWLARAEEAAGRALQIEPLLPEAHRARGGNLRYRGRLLEAVNSYLTAYELEPTSARAAGTLGDIQQSLGRPDLAIRWFEKAMRNETRPIYAENLGDAWTDLGEYEKAEEAFRAAAIFRPDLPGGEIGLIRLLLFRGEYDKARAACEKTRDTFPNNPQPTMMSAQVEFFSRNYRQAEIFLKEALIHDYAGGVDFAGSLRFLSALGFIRKNSGATTEGEALLGEARLLDEKETRLAPNNARRLYSLAATEAALNRSSAAFLALDRAIAAGWVDYQSLDLDPRFDSLREIPTFQDTLNRMKNKIQAMRR